MPTHNVTLARGKNCADCRPKNFQPDSQRLVKKFGQKFGILENCFHLWV